MDVLDALAPVSFTSFFDSKSAGPLARPHITEDPPVASLVVKSGFLAGLPPPVDSPVLRKFPNFPPPNFAP